MNLHYMRRLALLIESLFELLAPLDMRNVYMNIAYMLNESMLDYLDSPLPYVIGMSTQMWGKMSPERIQGL